MVRAAGRAMSSPHALAGFFWLGFSKAWSESKPGFSLMPKPKVGDCCGVLAPLTGLGVPLPPLVLLSLLLLPPPLPNSLGARLLATSRWSTTVGLQAIAPTPPRRLLLCGRLLRDMEVRVHAPAQRADRRQAVRPRTHRAALGTAGSKNAAADPKAAGAFGAAHGGPERVVGLREQCGANLGGRRTGLQKIHLFRKGHHPTHKALF
mmetsp:Transcript_65423/g.165788  ORF Transcript_65423/g.165788 Transcript_65423/m.165788 type:complete len:206 (-) Transcript_65423:741-1358(-)